MAKDKNAKGWINRWDLIVRRTEHRNIWQVKDGGYLLRGRPVNPATGKETNIKRVLRDADYHKAQSEWLRLRGEVKTGSVKKQQANERFADFAWALFEKKSKAASGDYKSQAGISKARSHLKHLIFGTPFPTKKNPGLKPEVPGLGEYFVHMLEEPIEHWRGQMGEQIAAGKYRPSTCNSMLSTLRVYTNAIAHKCKIPDPCKGIEDFDESEHPTYTAENPNTLTSVGVLADFLVGLFRMFPQLFAMAYLEFITGLRPSSIRPLRRRGPESDVKWDEGKLWIRQSHTLGKDVMRRTKQGTHYSIDLPEHAMAVLNWHVHTQLRRPCQEASDLLFPNVTDGGFRARSVLNKAFQAVSKAIGLPFMLTPGSGCRRTFNDIARKADIDGIVIRSISGHLTEQMQTHYSTVDGEEQREGIARIGEALVNKMTEKNRGENASELPTQFSTQLAEAPTQFSTQLGGASSDVP